MTEEEFKKIAVDHGCKIASNGWRTEAIVSDYCHDEVVAVFYPSLRSISAWFTLRNPLENGGCIQTIGTARGFKSPIYFNKAFDKFRRELNKVRKEIRMMRIEEL